MQLSSANCVCVCVCVCVWMCKEKLWCVRFISELVTRTENILPEAHKDAGVANLTPTLTRQAAKV